MQHDWGLKAIRTIRYPWVDRTDRTIYQQHPELDPIKLANRSLMAALLGYWAGRLGGWNRTFCALGAVVPFVGKFLIDEWKLSSKLTPYGLVHFDRVPKIDLQWSHSSNQSQSSGQRPKGSHSHFYSVRALPDLNYKLYSAADVVEQLSPGYFR